MFLFFLRFEAENVLKLHVTVFQLDNAVNYHDDTSDFLSPNDFDGVEVILEPL